ncbi:type II secretion system protein [Proteiniclasticum sp. C24MP]|uniref:type II secretion system protein n=1 Tax=Proteiniclasticum sp. C24MP TaxID=3374101 RepID=UPI003754352B
MIKLRKKQKGFTLVELLIVIAIIAVLAAVVTPVALSAINDSKATAVLAEIKSVETADLTYYVQNNADGDITKLDLAGLTGNKTKNAAFELDGSNADGSVRVLKVEILNGASPSTIAKKAGATAEATDSTVYVFSDRLKVNFVADGTIIE